MFVGSDLDSVLDRLKEVLPSMDEKWQLLLVIVEEHKKTPRYSEIKHWTSKSDTMKVLVIDSGLEFQRVIPLSHKVLIALNEVNTKYITIVDESHIPVFEGLNKLVANLVATENLTAIRGEVSTQDNFKKNHTLNEKNKVFPLGEGIAEFGLSSFLAVGTVYETSALKQKVIMSRLKNQIRAHMNNPWVYINLLMAANYNTALAPDVVAFKREIKKTNIDKMTEYFSWRSFGQRCDQLIALRNAIYEAFIDKKNQTESGVFDTSGFYNAYRKLCYRILNEMLVSNGKVYFEQMMSQELIGRSFAMFSAGSVQDYPNFKIFKDGLIQNIMSDLDVLLKVINTNKFEKKNGLSLNFYSSSV